jgi:hypothetical protein
MTKPMTDIKIPNPHAESHQASRLLLTGFALIYLVLLVLTGCTPVRRSRPSSTSAEAWVVFKSDLAKFSVHYPSPPSESVDDAGEHAFRVIYSNGERVLSVRYQPNADTEVTLGERFANVRDQLKADKMELKDTDVRGHRGMEATYQAKVQGEEFVFRHRLFYVGGAFYQVIGVRSARKGGDQDIDRFFESFRFADEAVQQK